MVGGMDIEQGGLTAEQGEKSQSGYSFMQVVFLCFSILAFWFIFRFYIHPCIFSFPVEYLYLPDHHWRPYALARTEEQRWRTVSAFFRKNIFCIGLKQRFEAQAFFQNISWLEFDRLFLGCDLGRGVGNLLQIVWKELNCWFYCWVSGSNDVALEILKKFFFIWQIYDLQRVFHHMDIKWGFEFENPRMQIIVWYGHWTNMGTHSGQIRWSWSMIFFCDFFDIWSLFDF